jgi:hypothetical protein
VTHLHEVLGRLKRAGFTLNPDKATLGAREIKYLGHLLALWRIKILPDRTAAIQHYLRPKNLKNLRRFISTVGFYGQFIPDYSRKAAELHELGRVVQFNQ